jgi:SPP1 gp7 family putative phage head morphogenesis protein
MQSVTNQVRVALHKSLRKDDMEDNDDESQKKAASIVSDLDLSGLDNIGDIESTITDTATSDGMGWVAEASSSILDGGGEAIVGVGEASGGMFATIHQRAVDYAKERTAELVTGIDEATRDNLRTTIASGIANGRSMDGISDDIKNAYAFSRRRADLIARTEITMANQNGVLAGMHYSKENGVHIRKLWSLDAVACPVCQANGDDGAIDLDEMFESGDQAPPAHPNCRCSLSSEVIFD